MSAHTPRTWYVGELYANTIAVKDQASGLVVAKASAMPSKIKEAEANAALIAAAPRLLYLLERYTHAYPAFRIRPVGAPGSQARIEQERLMALEEEAMLAIRKAKGGAA